LDFVNVRPRGGDIMHDRIGQTFVVRPDGSDGDLHESGDVGEVRYETLKYSTLHGTRAVNRSRSRRRGVCVTTVGRKNPSRSKSDEAEDKPLAPAPQGFRNTAQGRPRSGRTLGRWAGGAATLSR